MVENRRKFLKFIWKVENFSYLWNETDNFLKSPTFYLDIFEGSAWRLRLYPRGMSSYKNTLSVYLERISSSAGPLGITIDYEIALLRPNGETEYVKEMKDRCFRKGFSYGFDNLVARERIFGGKKSTLLPEDVLTLQCCIFPKCAELETYTEVIARTHTNVERLLWQWKEIEYTDNQFITLYSKGDERNMWLSVEYNASSGKDEGKLNCKFHCNEEFKVFHCRISILDSNNSVAKILVNKFFDINSESSSIRNYLFFPLVKASELLENKSLYLPNGKLNLDCEITLSFGLQHSRIEGIARNVTFKFLHVDKTASTSQIDLPRKKFLYCIDNIPSSFKNDFQNLYNEETLSDFIIKVGNNRFKVHKVVLCARSPVFKAMLTSDMKEKKKDMMDISDLEFDTVHCMLKYMYTDMTDDLDWDSAKKLYFAADKYSLYTLLHICSEVLKLSLSVSNVREVLALGNMHADDNLKKMSVEYICDHETEVIVSTEWKTFMTEDINLAAETMYNVFLKKAENRH